MQQTALGSSTSQEISWIQYSVNITPILTTVLSRLNPIHHTFLPYFLKIHFNIILSNMSSSSKQSLFLQVFWAKLLTSSSHTHTKNHMLISMILQINWLGYTAPWPWQGTCCAGPSTCSVILCNRIKITLSVEFDNQEQSFATHHNQMHVPFGLIMRGGCVKKQQCITVKFLATVSTLLCEKMGRKKIQAVNFSQRWFM